MMWWVLAILALTGPGFLAAELVPPSWYGDVFKHAFWVGSLFTAVTGALAGLLFPKLQNLIDLQGIGGWRERDRRAAGVHRIRRRLVTIIGVAFFFILSLVFLPLVGPRLSGHVQPYAAGWLFGVSSMLIYFEVSLLARFIGLSAKEHAIIREQEKQKDRNEILNRLRKAKYPGEDKEPPNVIDGHIQHH